ncbi:hypothetical protein [Neobacillus mesonae]|uniref:hypothetical protein n=1 Tax=Neobacillus mesonae TaxID=1193713 RepID=UPI002573ABB7|nr:hypothetical protein [Neobacillus mesonae]
MSRIMLRNVIEDDLPLFLNANRTMKHSIWQPSKDPNDWDSLLKHWEKNPPE